MEKIYYKILLVILFIVIAFLGHQVFGGYISDFFSHGKNDEERKEEIYNVVGDQVYNFQSNNVFGIYDNLDVIGLTDRIFEQEQLSGVEYSDPTIKMIVNNESIDLLLDSEEEIAGRGNLG